MAIKYGRPIESRVRVVPAEAKAHAETPPLELDHPDAPEPPQPNGRGAWCARTC